jgi:hypothetical protein
MMQVNVTSRAVKYQAEVKCATPAILPRLARAAIIPPVAALAQQNLARSHLPHKARGRGGVGFRLVTQGCLVFGARASAFDWWGNFPTEFYLLLR